MNSEYQRVGEAIADELFGSDHAGSPVYALADEGSRARIAAQAGITSHPLPAIAALVRATLALDSSGAAPFRWQSQMASKHRREPLETPPALPLLLILSIAAEMMHADGDVAAHNYYSRLHKLLGTPADCYGRVEEDYRRHADELWNSLNTWLEAWEGERGIPTAYAVGGHAYIGLPISQAVVRQHDRGGLHQLFALEGLTPGVGLSPSDMEAAMDPYARAMPSPLSSHLIRLWNAPAARERIVDAACLELEAWDGSGRSVDLSSRQSLSTRLLAFLRTFPRKSVVFNLMLPYRSEGSGIAWFDSDAGEVSVPTVVGSGSSTRLAGVEAVNATSLVGEMLSGRLGEDRGRPFSRRPRRIVSLRWDDLQGAYVEVERISLGEDSLVLAKDDARQRVETHLAAHARPGWQELPGLPGTPDDWLIYQHVQVISAPTERTHFDLLPLVPRTRTSLAVRGGFVLPGLLRKWSSLEPPEIVAVAAGATSIAVRVYDGTRVNASAVLVEVDQPGELVVVPLSEHELVDGEYLAAMYVEGASQPSSRALIRLRSANTPQFSVDEVDIRLVYSPSAGPIWPLSAGAPQWSSYVNGARPIGLRLTDSESIAMREFVPRKRPREPATSLGIRVGKLMAEDSCLVTGMHRFQLPPVIPRMPPTRTVEGECVSCGLVRRFAGTPWAARRRDRQESLPNRVVTIPPVIESERPDFQVAFDSLNHIGHGNFTAFERVSAQVEGSGLFADTFLRRQEVAGHIDVARDSWFQVSEWAVNSATLVPVGPRRWVLIGSRSRTLIDQLRGRLRGLAEVVESVAAELARVDIVGNLGSGDTVADLGVTVLAHPPAPAVAESLPPLGAVAAVLKRVTVPAYRTSELWDTSSASWREVESLVIPGAYRLKDFRSLYVVRSPDDIERGTVGIGNAQLVKHIANLWADDPLAGYHSRSGSVVVPLGADLPAVYGRALALCSGSPPRELVESRLLQYPSVPREVANTIFARLVR